jgi:hypothetical protein
MENSMKRAFALTLTLALLVPAGASAQALWDAPSFMHAGAPPGLTLALTDSDPGDGLAFVALWRRAAAPVGLGFRAGLAEAPGDDLAALFGIDVSGALPGLGGANGPTAMWWTGGGVGVGNHFVASFPLGLAFGWTLEDESVAFIPYVGAHVVLDVHESVGADGPGRNNDNLDLEGVFDLGLDLSFPSGWVGRFGAALGGRESLGVGFRVPTGSAGGRR